MRKRVADEGVLRRLRSVGRHGVLLVRMRWQGFRVGRQTSVGVVADRWQTEAGWVPATVVSRSFPRRFATSQQNMRRRRFCRHGEIQLPLEDPRVCSQIIAEGCGGLTSFVFRIPPFLNGFSQKFPGNPDFVSLRCAPGYTALVIRS